MGWHMRGMETNERSEWRRDPRHVGERHTHVRVEAQTERNMQTQSRIIFYVFYV